MNPKLLSIINKYIDDETAIKLLIEFPSEVIISKDYHGIRPIFRKS